MPADLDLVVRLDLASLRRALGEEVEIALERLLRAAPEAAPDAGTRRLVLALLSRAKTAWIGVRPGLPAPLTDNVVVLRGEFAGVIPHRLEGEPSWGAPRDLGGGVLRFEREAPKLRVAPAVLYVRGPDLVVWGSYAEIDALERTIELGRGDPPLVPADTGLASLSARLGSLQDRLVRRAPMAARLLEGAETLGASAGWTGTELDVRLELRFDDARRAEAVAEALAAIVRLLASSERSWLGAAKIDAVERFVTARVRIPAGDLVKELGVFAGPVSQSGGTVPAE